MVVHDRTLAALVEVVPYLLLVDPEKKRRNNKVGEA